MENTQSKVILETIEEQGGVFVVKFTYQIAGSRFPIEKLEVTNTIEDAYKILEKFKDEYRQRTRNISQTKIEENINSNIEENRKWYSEIISFEFRNGYWWLGLILTTLVIFLGCLGFLFIRNANEKDKKAYASGVWKGCFLYIIIKAVLGS